MKHCAKCNTDKPLSEFNKNKSKPDGLQKYCRLCTRAIAKQGYVDNPNRRDGARASKVAAVARNKAYVAAYLADHPCVDCGEDDVIVLEFDHLDDKVDSISKMVFNGFGLATIKAEILKCEVRCANCHRRITHKRRQADIGALI